MVKNISQDLRSKLDNHLTISIYKNQHDRHFP